MSESRDATQHDDIQPEGLSASEKEAMRTAHNVAITSNEKIFPIFARKLSSGDTKDYIHTTNKFAIWLASEKAYYPAARTKIVELLEIALTTFVDTFVRHQAAVELAEQLRKLVASVIPFLHLFPELELQARLQRVIQETSACLPASPGPSPPSSVPSASSPTITSMEPIGGSSTVLPTETSPPSPVTTLPQVTGETVSPIAPPRPQPRRLRKAELSEELKARDLDWFKSSQNIILGGADARAGASSSTGGESPAISARDISVSTSTSPKKKTARMVPSRRAPRRLTFETVQDEGQPVPGSEIPPVPGLSAVPFEIVSNVEELPMDVDDPGQATPSDVRVTQETDMTQRRSLSSDLQIVSMLSTSPSIEPSWSPAGPSTNADPGVSTGRSASSPETSNDMQATFTDLDAVPPYSPSLRRLETPILPLPVAAMNPPLNLDFKVPMKLHVETSTSQRRFDGKMTVVHIILARPFTHVHIVDMILSESLFSNVAKWVNRKAEPNHAPGGICISLGCYRLPEFFKTIRSEDGTQGTGTQSIEELMFNSSCSWPGSNRMSLRIKRDTKDTIVTLSPPLFLTPDQCVDISSLLTPGTNTLEIKQIGDLSEYGLVIHAHHPTRVQLAELEMVKAADERWKRFLETICVKVGPGGKVRGEEVLATGGGTGGVVGVL